jgi:hypothetical protein
VEYVCTKRRSAGSYGSPKHLQSNGFGRSSEADVSADISLSDNSRSDLMAQRIRLRKNWLVTRDEAFFYATPDFE